MMLAWQFLSGEFSSTGVSEPIWAGQPILLPTASKQLNLGTETLFLAYERSGGCGSVSRQ